jgi:hypothetical protein
MKAEDAPVADNFYTALSKRLEIDGELSLKEIHTLFPDVNAKTVSWRLFSLVQQGKLFKVGHGYYTLKSNRDNNSTGYEYLQKKSQKIYDILIEYGYRFYLSGLDALVGKLLHMPEEFPVLLVVEESGLRAIQEELSEKSYIVLLEKDKDIVDRPFLKNKVDVIILKGNDFSLSHDYIAQKEKGFVDLYYAVTRMDYGLSIPELSRTYQNLQRNESIATSKMKSAAKDRGIYTEINWLIELSKVPERSIEFMSYQLGEVKGN